MPWTPHWSFHSMLHTLHDELGVFLALVSELEDERINGVLNHSQWPEYTILAAEGKAWLIDRLLREYSREAPFNLLTVRKQQAQRKDKHHADTIGP